MPAAPATEAAIERAIKAAQDRKLVISAVEVTRDGTVRIVTAPPESLDTSAAAGQVLRPKQWKRG